MPFIIMRRTDIPNGVLQVDDLKPNDSQRNYTLDPPGQSGYVRDVPTEVIVITTGAGTAIVTITKQGGGLFTEVETEALITAIQYQHTDTSAPTNGDRLINVTVNDGTDDSAAARTTINVNPVNDQPSFSGLDKTPTFSEGGSAVVLDSNATIADPAKRMVLRC